MHKRRPIGILDRVSEPNDRRPRSGRSSDGRAAGDKFTGARMQRAPITGMRTFRGARTSRADSEGRRPSPAMRLQARESPHPEHVPGDPIEAYLAERGDDAALGTKTRFVSPFYAPKHASADLEAFLSAVSETFPVRESRRGYLKEDVLRLWRELTSERSERASDYLGNPSALMAYVRYFMAWNVVRLVPVLASLPLDLPKGAKLLDIGSGPLTLPIALWIARPDLRDRGLRVLCTDRVRRTLESGSAVLDALRLKTGGPILGEGAWKVETHRAVFPEMEGHVKADLVTAANAFTEIFWSRAGRRERTLGERAASLMENLSGACKPGGRIFIAEPGEPRSGAMLSAMREAVILSGFSVESPCTHHRACPMAGAFGGMGDREDGRARSALPPVHSPRWRSKMPWCHFPVPLDIAPRGLVRFSEEIGLPKDRLTVSWLALRKPETGETKTEEEQRGRLRVRLVSDPIRLPGGFEGRYSCSDLGYTLVVGAAAQEAAGSVLETERPAKPVRDDKSGAVLIGP